MIGLILIMSGYVALFVLIILVRGLPLHLALHAKQVFQITGLANSLGKIRGVKHSSLGTDRIKGLGEWVHTPRSVIRVGRFSFQLGHTRFGHTIPLSAGELADALTRGALNNMPLLRHEDLEIIRGLIRKVNKGEQIKKESPEWLRYSDLCNQMLTAKHLEHMVKEDKNDSKEDKDFKADLKVAIDKFNDPMTRSELAEDERTVLYQAQLSTYVYNAIDVVRIGTFFENTFDTEPALVQHDRIQEEAREQSETRENLTKLLVIMMVGIIAAGIVAAVIMGAL